MFFLFSCIISLHINYVYFFYFFVMQNILVCTYDEQLLPEKKTPEAIAWDIRTATDFTLQP